MLLLILTSLLAFYLAWNLGANDVANSMGTSVGSKAITLRQALIIAGILELAGALLFGQQVSATLATQIVNPAQFVQASGSVTDYVLGMVAVVVAGGLWLNIATLLGLPVSSSHAIVGAIAGVGCLAVGIEAVNWPSIGIITLSWIITPVVSGAIAAGFYSLIQRGILQSSDAIARLREFIPWLSALILATFGVLVLPTIAQPLQVFLSQHIGLIWPLHTVAIGIGMVATLSLTWTSWQQLDQSGSTPQILNSEASGDLTPQSRVERQLVRFQILSACFVAFAHGANDVGNAVAPLAAIAYVNRTGTVPIGQFQTPFWILLLGGIGIVAGLAVLGKKVIATVGGGIIPLQPSGGFCAQLGAATTVLLASKLGLPVSTSHAIVGGVVGVGLLQGIRAIRLQTLQQIGLVWVITIPAATAIAAIVFVGLRIGLRFLL